MTSALPEVTAKLRECWVLASNFRLSAEKPDLIVQPTIHAIVVESVRVDEQHRRQGHCKRLLEQLCEDRRFDLVIVEGVQNPILAEALTRWGWEFDAGVMDFYWRSQK